MSHNKENIKQLVYLFVAGVMGLLLVLTGMSILAKQMNPPQVQTIIVDATAGFQNSYIRVKKGQKITLEPEGRINLAFNQISNRSKSIKPLIINNAPSGTFAPEIIQRYPLTIVDEVHFNRHWITPEGESTQSDFLDECKLRPGLNWGTLLAVILPQDVSSQADPFQVLNNQGINNMQLLHVNRKRNIEVQQNGWLTFIINEAVLSPYSSSNKSKIYYNSLKTAEQKLSSNARHNIGSIPLVWFSDNLGSFRVRVITNY